MLAEIISQKIQEKGSITFYDFMNMSLYYPKLGYYNSDKKKIGKDGDFLTSCEISEIFGELIARQIEEMWEHLGKTDFTIVEFGAGTGALCKSILNYLKQNKLFFEKLDYIIVEKSPVMQDIERNNLNFPNKVKWVESAHALPEINGCILSNELIDNFPVHCVMMKEKLMEIHVGYKNDFFEILYPAGDDLIEYFKELKIKLPEGYRTEVNIDAIKWIRTVSEKLKKGYVITIDYGYPSGDLYGEQNRNGTIICYRNHRISFNPYKNIGEQDITSHINFSAICLWGFRYGLEYVCFTNQMHFLMALGFEKYLKEKIHPESDYKNFLNACYLTNVLIHQMGEKLKILIQKKGVPDYKLTGAP
jgi:SAM-dependent MidA family methyltransferase